MSLMTRRTVKAIDVRHGRQDWQVHMFHHMVDCNYCCECCAFFAIDHAACTASCVKHVSLYCMHLAAHRPSSSLMLMV